MKRQRDLQERLRALRALRQAIGAMKSLSAHHFRQSRAALAPARAYRDGIERLLASTGASLPAGSGPTGLLIIGSELGLCGAYNARLVEAAAEQRAALGPGPTFCLGQRAGALLRRRGVSVDRSYPAPTSTGGITETLLSLARDLLGDFVAGGLSGFDIVSARFEGVGAYRPMTTTLLPVDTPTANFSPVARYTSSDHLAAVAVRELLYIDLFELLLDALASEHGARLTATQSAEQWLDERTETLRRHLASATREASTQELIEIVTGARARRA